MANNQKTHAKDYLSHFADQQEDWLKSLVINAINTNGNISDPILNKIYEKLKDKNAKLVIPALTSFQISDHDLTISKLEHVKGVNALAPNQIIKFNDDVTILYGLNGAGKSGYFKILNEIVGGNEQKELIPNIHVEKPEDIQVILSYYHDKDRVMSFNGTERAISPLTGCKVFDSSYLSGLLAQRTQTETILTPLGLHLFNYLAEIHDNFKSRLIEDADGIRIKKPPINTENFSEVLKNVFILHEISERTQADIESNYELSDEDKELLKNKKESLKALNQTNFKDKITVLSTVNTEFQSIIDFIALKDVFLAFNKNLQEKINDYNQKLESNKKALEKVAILNDLPFKDAKDWKTLITAGEKVRKSKDISTPTCVYCNQPLEEQAQKIIQAYSSYLVDETESELEEAKKALTEQKKIIEAKQISISLSDNFKEEYKTVTIDDKPLEVKDIISCFEQELIAYKTYLLKLDSDEKEEEPEVSLSEEFSNWINKTKTLIENQITQLRTDENEKDEKASKLTEEIKKLKEKEAISNQKIDIKKWITETIEEFRLREQSSSLNTGAITRLSSKAHEELLTQNLNNTFQTELNNLGYRNLEVDLVKARGGKGTTSTKLVLKDNNEINYILSEGEQKAVGLALFIAEASIQNVVYPIILDDPVNSLDHKIAGKFADRLLSLNNQLIIFNHNRLFQDAFETSKLGHICKTIDTACNKQKKHILVYDVSSEGKSRKGVLSFHKNNTASNHLISAKQELQKSPLTEHIKVSALLRKAVECIVDEKILNGVIPTKYSNKNSRIPWDNLKEINNSPENIEIIRKVHDRVSGGDLHNGTESENNPIDVDEFNSMVSDLEKVLLGAAK